MSALVGSAPPARVAFGMTLREYRTAIGPAGSTSYTPPVIADIAHLCGTPRRAGKLAAVVTATALAVAVDAGSALAASPPTLAGWKLTLPVSSSGCQCGDAAQVNPAAATPPWLVRNSDGSLTFWTPTKGAHTPNSRRTRTELNSLTSYRAGSGTHTLQEILSVQKLPSGGDIIIGQIHGTGTNSAVPLLMLHYKQGNLVVATRNSPTVSGDSKKTVLSDVPLNAPFSYTITQSDGNFLVSASHGSKQQQITVPVPASFTNMDVRFQTGDYQQTDANDSDTDGGQLTVTALSQS